MTADIEIRPATSDDLSALTDIYNHYVINTHITFDTEPLSPLDRQAWLDRYRSTGRHQLLIAAPAGTSDVVGYASSGQFRVKPAYDTSVETTVYLHPEEVGRGLGSALYQKLFERLAGEDVHRCYGGIALPNDASIALHEAFGFIEVAHLHQVGRKFDRYWDVVWMEKAMD